MSEIRVNKVIDEAGTGAVELTQGATLPTGKTISGAGSISIGGDITATGNVSVGGTLTYNDVTNIDSVGLITARSGINVTGGNTTLKGAVETVNVGAYSGTELTLTQQQELSLRMIFSLVLHNQLRFLISLQLQIHSILLL